MSQDFDVKYRIPIAVFIFCLALVGFLAFMMWARLASDDIKQNRNFVVTHAVAQFDSGVHLRWNAITAIVAERAHSDSAAGWGVFAYTKDDTSPILIDGGKLTTKEARQRAVVYTKRWLKYLHEQEIYRREHRLDFD